MPLLQPSTLDELAEAVATAAEERETLEVTGAGTKRGFGRPMQTAHTLAITNLSGIRMYEPEELVMTVAAGTKLGEIKAALDKKNQHLSFEPPNYGPLFGTDDDQTIGGIIGANLSGPRRVAAGAARDLLLGVTGVNGRGEIVKSGGRVVKNVTGYDLSKLIAGSFGTLLAMAELTLKALPKPERIATLLIEGVNPREAVNLLSHGLGLPVEVSGAAWLNNMAALRLEGMAGGLGERMEMLKVVAKGRTATQLDDETSVAFWASVRDAEPFHTLKEKAIWRISVPPMNGPNILEAFPGAPGFLDWGGGLVWLALEDSGNAGSGRLRALTKQYGGHATLLRASDATRALISVFEPQPNALAALSRRVKASFDPRGIFNPGRMVAGL